jgi:hypothetical protein
VFIDELTWEETRDLMKAGRHRHHSHRRDGKKRVPHDARQAQRHRDHSANLMARRSRTRSSRRRFSTCRKAIPTGRIPAASPCRHLPYDQLLDAAARSLRAHGFKEIIFIGDSGGNQSGMTAVATALNEAWKGQDVKVFALTDYYNQGRDNYRAWMEAAFGYDDQTLDRTPVSAIRRNCST